MADISKNFKYRSFVVLFFLFIVSQTSLARIVQTQDTICCYVLRDSCINKPMSRVQFIMYQHECCELSYHEVHVIDSLLKDLEYIGNLEYNPKQLVVGWKLTSDSILSVENLGRPVKALILKVSPPLKKRDRPIYSFDKDVVYCIWVTDETVEIEDREYKLSPELRQFLFRSKDA